MTEGRPVYEWACGCGRHSGGPRYYSVEAAEMAAIAHAKRDKCRWHGWEAPRERHGCVPLRDPRDLRRRAVHLPTLREASP